MAFLHWLENIRIPVLNEIMLGITYLGDEVAFLVIALILFWCVDKRKGYYILSVGFIGTIANQFMKLWFRIPRPWVLDSSLQPMEQALEGAGGFSFPSGHTQTSVGTFGGIAYTTKNKLIRIACLVLAVLVPFSRMYVGVHTPMDVGVGAAMAILLIFLVHPFVFKKDGKYFPVLMAVMTAMAIAYMCFVELYPFPVDIDPERLLSGKNNAYTMLGCLVGLLIVYIVDEKWLRFPVKGVWWVQIIKIVVGLLLVLAIKSGLKTPLNALFGEFVGRAVRYFLMVIMAGIVWPLSFKLFAKIGKKG